MQGTETDNVPRVGRPPAYDRRRGPEHADITLQQAKVFGVAPIDLGLHGVIARGTGSSQRNVGATGDLLTNPTRAGRLRTIRVYPKAGA